MFNTLSFVLRLIARIYGHRFYENIDFTRSVEDLNREGIAVRASGFVIDGNEPAGVYVVKYRPSIKENRYGRYN